MVIQPRLEFWFACSDVAGYSVGGCYSGFVDEALLQTIARKWTCFILGTTAGSICLLSWGFEEFGVVVPDCSFHIGHTGVAQLDVVSVE